MGITGLVSVRYRAFKRHIHDIMPSYKHLKPDQLDELREVTSEWIKVYGLKGLAKRMNTSVYRIKQALLANEIENEWTKTSEGVRSSKK